MLHPAVEDTLQYFLCWPPEIRSNKPNSLNICLFLPLKHSLFFYTQDRRGPSGTRTCCVGVRSGQSVVVCFCWVTTQGYWILVLRSLLALTQSLRAVAPGFVSNGLTCVSQQFHNATDLLSKQTFQWEAFKEDFPHVMLKISPSGENVNLEDTFLSYFNQSKDFSLIQSE